MTAFVSNLPSALAVRPSRALTSPTQLRFRTSSSFIKPLLAAPTSRCSVTPRNQMPRMQTEVDDLPEPLEDVAVGRGPASGPAPMHEDRKLFVGNLSWNTSDVTLSGAFEKFGTVVDARVIFDRYSGKSRGFGFVEFEEPASAQEALAQMNGIEVDGREIRVDRANKKQPPMARY